MHKKMIKGTLVLLVVLLSGLGTVRAVPPLPSSLYGTVKSAGENVPPGTTVSAWINGVQYAHTTVYPYETDTAYTLVVPGDDPATVGVIEGGKAGDTVVLMVGSQAADQTASWASASNQMLNLTLSPSFMTYLPLILR